MAGIVPELTHGVLCPGRGSFCPGNVKIDHRAWIYGQKCTKTVATRAAACGSYMHQIVCRLELRPIPHWGSLQRSPDPLAGLRGGPSGKGKEGREGKRREGRGGSPGMLKSRVVKPICNQVQF